jgi:hypothetical protein
MRPHEKDTEPFCETDCLWGWESMCPLPLCISFSSLLTIELEVKKEEGVELDDL